MLLYDFLCVFTIFNIIIDGIGCQSSSSPSSRVKVDKKKIVADEGSDVVVDCLPVRLISVRSSLIDFENPEEDVDAEITGAAWKKDGTPISYLANSKYIFHGENDSLTILRVTVSDEGTYQCITENKERGGGGLTMLKVKEKLKFVDPLGEKKMELNSNSKLHCKTRSFLPASTYWIKNGSPSMPEHVKQENGTLIFNGVTQSDAGKYICYANDSASSINMTTNVLVIKGAKLIKKPPEQLEALLGSNVTLSCFADGDPSPIVHWDKNLHRNKNNRFNRTDDNSRIFNFPNGSLLILNVSSVDEGKYGCTAGNTGGFDRAEVNLFVKTSEPEDDGDNDKITRTIMITSGAVVFYLVFILFLMIWFRHRTNSREAAAALVNNQNGGGSSAGDATSSLTRDENTKLNDSSISMKEMQDVNIGRGQEANDRFLIRNDRTSKRLSENGEHFEVTI